MSSQEEQDAMLAAQFPKEMLQELVDGPFQQFDVVTVTRQSGRTERALVLLAHQGSCLVGLVGGGTVEIDNDWLTYVGMSAVGLRVREMYR